MTHSQHAWPGSALARSARGQRGMATMLIILLIGVGTVSISLASISMIRSTQERQIASHAQVNAQSGAWAAVEAMRQYLLTLDAAAVAALPVNRTWTLDGYTGFTQTAHINSVTGPVAVDGKTAYRINMRISATAIAAKSSSVLEVVYQTFPGGAGVTAPNTSVIHYHGDLNLTGGIEVLKDAGDTKPYEINVIGNVTVNNVSVTGVNTIRSTGSVEINGATSFIESIFANCDVLVSGASAPHVIKTTRHICLTNTNRQGYPAGDKNSVDMLANGSIILDGSTSVDGVSYGHKNVWALAGKGGHSYCAANAKTTLCDDPSKPWVSGISSIFGANAVNPTDAAVAGGVYAVWDSKTSVIRSNNDIIIQGTATTDQLHAERHIQYLNGGGTVSTYARHGGDMITAATWIYNNLFGVNNSSGKDQKVAFTEPLIPASRVSLQTEKFDVNDLKGYANYIFSVDSNNRMRVVVRQVKNSSDASMDYEGTDRKGYYLKSIWLCRTDNAVIPANANAPTTDNCPIKISNLLAHPIKYESGKWVLGNQPDLALAPGLAFFEGNLEIQSGTFYNTFLATGNITNSGATKVYAPNFAGYNGTQNGTRYTPHGICADAAVPNLIPTQFCTGTTYNFSAIQGGVGNYALMAGTCAGANPCTNANYQGGNISTGASSDFFGALKAGNTFITSGSSTVHGYVSALAQGVQAANHALTAKTTIDLRNLPPGFDPGGGPKNPSGSTPGSSAEVSVLWSRYF